MEWQALHRVRDRLVPRRTSVINQIRAFLLERGISFHTGRANLRRHMAYLLEDTNQKLTARLRRLLHLLWQEWQHLEIQIESLTEEIEWQTRTRPVVGLRQIPGVGFLGSNGLLASIGKSSVSF